MGTKGRKNITSPDVGAEMVRDGAPHQETRCVLCSRIPGESKTELQQSQWEEQNFLAEENQDYAPFLRGRTNR